MAMYIFVLPFREANICVVPSRVSHKLRCATGEVIVPLTVLMQATASGNST
jgi:hypothetical protein